MLRLPAYVQLEITDICNLRCKYCYHFNTEEMPESQDLSDEQTILLVEKLIEDKIYSLIITGGEPLARFDLTTYVVEMAKKAGVFVSINTNLLLLTPVRLARLKASGVDSLLVSCPASDPETYLQVTRCGDYQKFCDNLRLLVGSGISCLVNMVATKSNHQFVRKTAADLVKLGIKRFAVTPASLNVEYPDFDGLLNRSKIGTLLEDLRWCTENLGLAVDILEPLPKCFFPAWCWDKEYAFTRRACQAGRMSASISNTGDVRPCSHNPIVYGNLRKESLEAIWSKMSIYRDDRHGALPDQCYHCQAVRSCNGGCRTNALATTGKLNQLDRLAKGPIIWPQNKANDLVINKASVIYLSNRIRWRKETDDNYSIASRKGFGNMMLVNEELFRFVCWLESSLPLTMSELIKSSTSSSDQAALIEIIKTLVRKDFIHVLSD